MEKIINLVQNWAINEKNIKNVIIVGSYATGKYKETSDLDLVIITPKKANYLADYSFINLFGQVISSQMEYYGECTSIRVFYVDNSEIEFGFVTPKWSEFPLDSATENILSSGYKILVDKDNFFNNIKI